MLACQLKQLQPRHYTVGYVSNGGKAQPNQQLKISGKWLEKLEFAPVQAVIITTERGKDGD